MKKWRFIALLLLLPILLYVGRYVVGSVRILHSYPDYTYSTYLKCIEAEKIRDEGLFLITEKAVCITAPFCEKMKDDIECSDFKENDKDRIYTWKVIKNINEHDVSYIQLKMNDSGFNYSEEPLSNYRRNAGIITIKGVSYFVWYTKGNSGRFFKIDKDTFEYLGNDQYRDKGGLIEKNTRVDKFKS